MGKVELSIIIVSYNTRQTTLNCLDSIVRSLTGAKISHEIVLVDNASTDGTVTAIKALELENLTLIESKTNVGFGVGNNIGVKKAKGKYILLLNSDTLVLNNGIEKLFQYFKAQKTFNFLGGKLLNKDMSDQPSAGPFYSLPVVFGALFLRGDYWALTRYSPSKVRKVDWVSGACILTTKETFNRLGGFDKNIFMYMEEIDLLYRAHKLGYKVGFYPEARFIHLGSVSSGGRTYPIIQVYNGFLYFYKKHRSKFELILLKFLLKLKALTALLIGRLTGNNYLIETYGKAYKMV
jgi:hypothetical protein